MRDAAAPRQLATLVEAESLFNDGTGVLLFTIAVGALGGGIDPMAELPAFVVTIVTSLALGAATGFVASRLTAVAEDYLLELTLTGLLAYGTYLAADALGQSGSSPPWPQASSSAATGDAWG